MTIDFNRNCPFDSIYNMAKEMSEELKKYVTTCMINKESGENPTESV